MRGSSLSPVLGRSIPNALRSAFRPTAIAMPTRIPTADANRPTTNASTITESSTCRRLAPIARRSAISLERCATMIENVLKMMNAPTKSAMKANTRRAIRKNPSPCFSAFDCSSATDELVTACTPLGSTCSMLVRSVAGSTPSAALTEIESKTPTLSSTFCAVGVSNSARVAPARLSASPNPAMPEMVNACWPPTKLIVIFWPTVRLYLLAVPASTTT